MYAKIQKTYRGKTAYQYLKDAQVRQMQAGNHEIVSPLWDGVLELNRVWGTLVLVDAEHGAVVQLELSPRDWERIEAMEAQRRQLDRGK